MTDTVPPSDDIGPIYKFMGFFALFIALGVIVVQALRGERIGTHDVIFVGVAAFLCLALVRPKNFDAAVKLVADKLPVFSYTKDK